MGEPSGPDETRFGDDRPPPQSGEFECVPAPLYWVRAHEFYLLWAVALLTYGIGDTATTVVAVNAVPTLVESNLIVTAVLEYGGLQGFLLVKLLVLLLMLGISVRGTRENDRFICYWPPLATAVMGALLTGWNLRLLVTVS